MMEKTKNIESEYRENNKVYCLDGSVDVELTKKLDELLYEPIEKVTIIVKKLGKEGKT